MKKFIALACLALVSSTVLADSQTKAQTYRIYLGDHKIASHIVNTGSEPVSSTELNIENLTSSSPYTLKLDENNDTEVYATDKNGSGCYYYFSAYHETTGGTYTDASFAPVKGGVCDMADNGMLAVGAALPTNN